MGTSTGGGYNTLTYHASYLSFASNSSCVGCLRSGANSVSYFCTATKIESASALANSGATTTHRRGVTRGSAFVGPVDCTAANSFGETSPRYTRISLNEIDGLA